MTAKTILILGAGIGGLVTAHELRRCLAPEHQVVLIDSEAQHRFQSSYLWEMTGQRRAAAIGRPLAGLKAKGIDFRQASVEGIDPVGRSVQTDAGTLSYDFLVVALGAQLYPDAVAGLAQAGHTPYTLDGAVSLRNAWQNLSGGRVAIVIAALPFKCPAAPYETALLLEAGLRERGVRKDVRIDLFTPETLPMPVAGEALGQALQGMLEKRAIHFHAKRTLRGVDPEQRQLSFADGSEAGYELLVYVPPHRSPEAVRQSPLAAESGWIPVDPRTLHTAFENVYAIGDTTALPLANGMLLPKAGVFAHGEATVVARRIADAVDGRDSAATYDGWGGCFIETGGGKAAYGSGNFLAEPAPVVNLHPASRSRHAGKVLFEKTWLAAVGGPRPVSRMAFPAMDFWGKTLLEQSWLWRWV